MKRNLAKRPSYLPAWLTSGFTYPLVLLLLILLFLPVRYEINDDLGMIKALTGSDGFPPRALVGFISQTLGQVLYSLYGLNASIPWYGLTIYLAAYLGASLITGVTLRSTKNARISLLLSFPALVIFFGHCFSFVTFTSATLLLECGVFLALMEWVLRGQCPHKHTKTYALFLVACFLLAFLLRRDLVLGSLPFAASILLFIKKPHLKGIALTSALIAVFVILEWGLFSSEAKSPRREAYGEYNMLRRQFNDGLKGSFHGDSTLKAIQKAGWVPEDYFFFRSWIMYDERLFNCESLRTFLEENDLGPKKRSLKEVWAHWKKNFRRSGPYSLTFILTLLAVLVYRFNSFRQYPLKQKAKISAALGIVMLGIGILMYFRFVPRVYVPLYAYITGMCLLLSSPNSVSLPQKVTLRSRKIASILLSLLFFSLALGQSYAAIKQKLAVLHYSKIEKEHIRKSSQVVEGQHPTPPLLVLMDPVHSGVLGADKVHPLKELSDYPALRIFPFGTLINSPRYYAALHELNLKSGSQFLKWTVDRDEVLFVTATRSRKQHRRIKYLWESYYSRRVLESQKAALVPVYDFRNRRGMGMVFYRMSSIG